MSEQKAGAFDVRVVIAALIGIYGVVLTVLGLIADPAEVAKAAGLNVNLWGGIAMLVFAAAFVLWARLRPIVVPAEEPDTGGLDVGGAPPDEGVRPPSS